MTEYTDNMTQDATYWPPGVPDGYGGISFGAPEALKVRWQDKPVLARNEQGEEFVSDAEIYVPKPLARKGYILLGNSIDPDPRNTNAKEILQIYATVNLDGKIRLSKVLI